MPIFNVHALKIWNSCNTVCPIIHYERNASANTFVIASYVVQEYLITITVFAFDMPLYPCFENNANCHFGVSNLVAFDNGYLIVDA